ncbi:MAG: DEAD/DEAH box helicase [Polyangia bacterium]|jgi:ATP-dependent RNA helicase RhlE
MNTISSFSQLDIIDPIRRALHSEGYTVPTPIQAQAIPLLLAGRDLLGCAQTGTGKTAAFAIPILTRLAGSPRREGLRGPRALVLAPTRELASQIGESFASYGRHLPLRHVVVFGGVGQKPQVDGIRRGAEILVATPGRLLDLMQQGHVRLDGVEALVLDEGDRMLDMGFIQPIRRIVAAVPRQRQTMLFSATLPPDIVALASGMLHNPATVSVTPTASTAEKVSQWVLHVQSNNKRNLLAEVLRDRAMARVLVFTRTKHGANRVAEHLNRGGVCSEAIHGNKSQSARERALAGFKKGSVRVLVATDIASRGIDVDGITHVINFEIPNEPESYVHRIGRTGRAGAAGIALSFCDPSERTFLRDIERLTRARLRVVERHPYSGPQRSPGAIALV